MDAATIHNDPALRRGLYGLGELTGLLNFERSSRIDSRTVARWAQHALSSLEHKTRRLDYSFADLIGMLVVRDLVVLGMSLGEIREAELYLRDRYGLEHPFLSERLRTDGADLFYEPTSPVGGQLTSANKWGQEVLEATILSALQGVSYEKALASGWAPVDGVYLDPSVQFGEPCIAGTAITTSRVAELVAHQSSTVQVAELFGIHPAVVDRAVSFEHALAA